MSIQLYISIILIIVAFTAMISAILSYKIMNRLYKKELKSDISLEQMKSSERRISDFLRENNLAPGTPISTIASVLNIVEGGVEDKISGRARLNEPDVNGKMVVVFKKGIDEIDKNFDFAHECGHRINGDPAPQTRPEGYNKSESDQLADYVAAALLMPIDSVYTVLNDMDFKNSSLRRRLMIVRKLCSQYNVSRVIALRRVMEVYALKEA